MNLLHNKCLILIGIRGKTPLRELASMSYQIARRFKKDLDKINDQKLLSKVGKCIEAIGTSQALSEIPELKSLKGLSGTIALNLTTAIVSEFTRMEKLLKSSK
jgi:hypothetical protein